MTKHQKLDETNRFYVTSDELKLKLDSKEPLMLFDMRFQKI
jgi:hypothetical protein